MIKCVFHEQCQLHTVYRCEKHIFNFIIHSQDRFFCGNLTWQNLEVLVDLANLTGRWSVKSLLRIIIIIIIIIYTLRALCLDSPSISLFETLAKS